MLRKYLYGIGAFVLAFAILSVSLLQSSSLIFAFNSPHPSPSPTPTPTPIEINYVLPFPGSIMPGSLLWPLKALRDKILLLVATGHKGKAEVALLLADKRLAAGDSIFDAGNYNLGITTIDKAEKYLETASAEEKIARSEGADTSSFLSKLALSSLKHRAILEDCIRGGSSAEVKNHLTVTLAYSKNIYRDTSEDLTNLGIAAPKSPFEGQ